MTISKVYSVAMTHLCVQLKGNPQTIRVKAAAVQENLDDNELVAKDAAGKIIGKFFLHEVTGWWTEDSAN
jgi:hypothetical protein